jgi:hypothetical protein
VPEPATPYIQFYTHDEYRWQYIHEALQELYNVDWEYNTYNRMALYIKSPDEIETSFAGTPNVNIGTYFSSIIDGPPTSGNAEVGGGNHGYHNYNIAGGGVTKLLLDFNPTHIRGENGSVEQPYMEYPIAADEGKYNYFDLLTRLYFSCDGATADGLKWNFDNLYFYRENRLEENHSVYSLSASRRISDDLITFSFNVDKEREAGSTYEVRYSFSDIHDVGFDNADLWVISPELGLGGYNHITLQKDDIDLASNDVIYIAVRKTGDTLFRQISLELDLG